MALTRQLSLTLGDARTKFRTFTVDEDTVNQAHSDAQANRAILDVYEKYWQRYGNRVKQYSGTQLALTMANGVLGGMFNVNNAWAIQKWLRLYRETDVAAIPSNASVELEKMERHRLLWLQKNRPQPTDNFSAYCVERVDAESTALVTHWGIRFWPLTATGAFAVSADVYLQAPVTLTSDSDLFDMDIEEANIVVRAAAAIASARLGRPDDFIENLWRTIPEDTQEYLRGRMDEDLPRKRPQEAAY